MSRNYGDCNAKDTPLSAKQDGNSQCNGKADIPIQINLRQPNCTEEHR